MPDSIGMSPSSTRKGIHQPATIPNRRCAGGCLQREEESGCCPGPHWRRRATQLVVPPVAIPCVSVRSVQRPPPAAPVSSSSLDQTIVIRPAPGVDQLAQALDSGRVRWGPSRRAWANAVFEFKHREGPSPQALDQFRLASSTRDLFGASEGAAGTRAPDGGRALRWGHGPGRRGCLPKPTPPASLPRQWNGGTLWALLRTQTHGGAAATSRSLRPGHVIAALAHRGLMSVPRSSHVGGGSVNGPARPGLGDDLSLTAPRSPAWRSIKKRFVGMPCSAEGH